MASAQVKSAILLAGLNARGTTTVINPTQLRPFRKYAAPILRSCCRTKTEDGADAISVAGSQKLLGCAVDVPSDPSSAAFPIVAALLIKVQKIKLVLVIIHAA